MDVQHCTTQIGVQREGGTERQREGRTDRGRDGRTDRQREGAHMAGCLNA